MLLDRQVYAKTLSTLLNKEGLSVVVGKEGSSPFADVENRYISIPPDVFDAGVNFFNYVVLHEAGHLLFTSKNLRDIMKANASVDSKGRKIIWKIFEGPWQFCEDWYVEHAMMNRYQGAFWFFETGWKDYIDSLSAEKVEDIQKPSNLAIGDCSPENFIERFFIYVRNHGSYIKNPVFLQGIEEEIVSDLQKIGCTSDSVNLAVKIYEYILTQFSEDQIQQALENQEAAEKLANAIKGLSGKTFGSMEEFLEALEKAGVSTKDGTFTVKKGSSGDNDSQGIEISVNITNLSSSGDKEENEASSNKASSPGSTKEKSKRAKNGSKGRSKKNLVNTIFSFPLLDGNVKIPKSQIKVNVSSKAPCVVNKPMLQRCVMRFERKSAALTYSQENVSKTGELDTNSLWSYKFNEDMFLRESRNEKTKSHSVMILLDASGSMADQMPEAIKQIIFIWQFCAKVGIHFEAWAFEANNFGGFPSISSKSFLNDSWRSNHEIYNFDLTQLGSTDWNKLIQKNVQTALLNNANKIPSGGTPLFHSLCIMRSLLKSQIERHKPDVSNFILITDGGDNQGNSVASKYFDGSTGKIYDDSENKPYGHLGNKEIAVLQSLRDSMNVNVVSCYISNENEMIQNPCSAINLAMEVNLDGKSNTIMDMFVDTIAVPSLSSKNKKG